MPASESAGLRGSLFRKYVAYFVALVSTALIVSGLVGFYFTYEESKTARLNLQLEKAEAAASRIESYIKGIEHQLGWMRLSQLGTVTPGERRTEYLKLLRQVPAITDVSLLDAEGREQLRVSRLDMSVEGSAADYSASPKFTETRQGKTYFSPVYFRKETEPYMTISVRGFGDTEEVTVAEVNLKFIWDVITRIKVGRKGFAYLVDGQGHLIAHPDISLVLKKMDLSPLDHVRAALRGQNADSIERVMISRNVQGVEALLAYANVAPLDWHVFVEQPLAEAFAPLYASLLRTGLLLLAGLVLAVVGSLFLAKHMVMPIRAIQAGAARIAAGKLDQSITVRTNDELEGLAGEFNAMAKQLRESYSSLERKVEERTRDLSESLEQQTATSEALRTISRSSFDLKIVLHELIRSAVKLGYAEAGGLYLRQTSGGYGLRVAFSEDLQLQHFMELHAREIGGDPARTIGCAIANRQPLQTTDLGDESLQEWARSGFQRALVVPIVREGTAIGFILALRFVENPFSEKQIGLITTFADQAGIAIENVRLFNESESKSRELELAYRHKSEFLANVSHELRTPLNAIIGFSEVLRERMFGEINAKQAEYLDDIHSSGKHLLSLINDILNLSKIEAGKLELEISRFDVRDAIQEALNVVREQSSRRGLALALELGPDVGEWVADERIFKQIMLNLLSNAVKFTAEGGKVAVHAGLSDGRLEVAVTDTGVGIAPDHLEIIFDEFRQVSADYRRRAEGTGLGLALTRKFVELHGGTIKVTSVLGKGSTFTFTLPEKAPAAV